MNRSSFGAALAFLALAAAPLSGCIKNDVQLGSGGGGGAGASNDWEGYVENYKFDSGSNKVAIHLNAPQGSSVTGTVRLGDAPDLPPPVDPNTRYPANLPMQGAAWSMQLPYEGFDFTLEQGTLTTDRLAGVMYANEMLNGWCAMQTSYKVQPQGNDYQCVPSGTTYFSDAGCKDDGVPIDCGKLGLCQLGACICDANACHGAHAYGALSFDIHIEGDQAHGSVVGLSGQEPLNVWLTRGGAP